MYKIFLSVRNRFLITKFCIQALLSHSDEVPQIYVYDNLTDYKLEEHFALWYQLYEKRLISQVTFTTEISTFNCFSKAVTSNLFGLQHQQDLNKHKYDFLLILDNDFIVTPHWDTIIKQAWKEVRTNRLNDVLVVTQLPGGIKDKKKIPQKIAGVDAYIGKLGGSVFWSFKPDFFDRVGFVPIKVLVGESKGHDMRYWGNLERATQNRPYILGLDYKLGFHCGGLVHSVCNILSKKKNAILKEYEDETDKNIEGLSFSEFYEMISHDENLLKEYYWR